MPLYPTRCEKCHGRFPKGVKAAGAHVFEVPEGALPAGAAETGKHYFCSEKCTDDYNADLTAKYAKAS